MSQPPDLWELFKATSGFCPFSDVNCLSASLAVGLVILGLSERKVSTAEANPQGLLLDSQGGWGTLDLQTARLPAFLFGLLYSVLAMAASFPQEVLMAEKICGPGSSI